MPPKNRGPIDLRPSLPAMMTEGATTATLLIAVLADSSLPAMLTEGATTATLLVAVLADISLPVEGQPWVPDGSTVFIPMLTTQKIQIYYYFEFPTRHPYKICWFEFWVRRPKRLALVAATAARFRGGGLRGGVAAASGGDRGCRKIYSYRNIRV